MELRHLRYFVAVAEERSFTRAAVRLRISQPPLSQQIQQLEREMEVALFERSARGASLTPAGERFLDDAQATLQLVEQAVQTARRTAQGELGLLRIGFTGSAAFHPFVTDCIRSFRSQYPRVRIELFEASTAAQLQSIEAGRLDACFVRPAEGEAGHGRRQHLFNEAMLVVVPQSHRLAKARRIRLAELAQDEFVLYPRENGRLLYDTIVGACRSAGFSLTVGQEAPQLASTVTLIAAGTGVSIVPESMSQLRPAGILYKPIAGHAPTAPLQLVWSQQTSKLLQNFVELVRLRSVAIPKALATGRRRT